MDIRRRGERRNWRRRPEYPFRDSTGEWVTHNRRRIVERRLRLGIDEILDQDHHLGNLLLHYREQVINLSPRPESFILGRRQQCHLVLDQDYVSREHARIAFKDNRFVLIDQSLNGTYIRLQNGEVVFLHQESRPLTGSGYLSLGRPLNENGDNLIYFFCREGTEQP
ncbi:FHA domain-containing protein [Thioalkalivibrio sulfidiphilus]|uniref:FHA domain-containing protein n=1 Tax=Thioalkalivibrio sulfidiphilus TaxID=1033854 RepID=UPI003B2F8B82